MNLKGKMLNFKAFCVEFAEKISKNSAKNLKIRLFFKKALNLSRKLVILSLSHKGEKALFEIFRFAQYDKVQHFFRKKANIISRKNPC